MEWKDVGIIIAVRPHGETSAVVELLTRDNGRHLGLVKGGRSRANRPLLQVGNLVEATWRARLDEYLGFYTLEGLSLRAARIMEGRLSTLALVYAAILVRLLPERDPHPVLFERLDAFIREMDESLACASRLIQFEVHMLAELGFGLDLQGCALTGKHTELAYVSPKTGRAVSAGAAGIWAPRLLPLPAFLVNAHAAYTQSDIQQAAQLTAYFFRNWIFEPRKMNDPDSRALYFKVLHERAKAE